MRQRLLGIKFFTAGQVSWTKKMSQKGRFFELSTEEIQQIMDKAVPETTKEPPSSG